MSAAAARPGWLQAALLAAAIVGGCVGPAPGLRSAAAELTAAPALAGGRVGFVVVDVGTGEVLAEHSAERGFATASNLKLVTAAVSLAALGPDATMRTELLARGELRDGVLDGDLVLRGHGDPTFGQGEAGEAAIAAFHAALQRAGVQRVRGRVVGDGAWLGTETLGHGWQWDYLDEDYAAPFGGLCAHGNVLTLRVRPGAAGAELRVQPALEAVPSFRVAQGPAGSPTELAAHRPLGSDAVVVTGTIAADAPEQVLRVAVRDPAAFAAASVTAALRARGLPIGGEVVPAAGAERLLAAVESPPVAAIVRPLLTDSNNLYAEMLFRVASRVATGDGSSAAAERHAKAVLGRLGVDTAHAVLADGSGLSRRNLVSPRLLADLLVAMQRSPHRDAFVAGLPVAGWTGTLRRRFADGPAHGRVAAKTGYISRVVCLSGYVPRRDPERPPLAFSVMLNDFTCDDREARATVDTFVQRLAAFAGW